MIIKSPAITIDWGTGAEDFADHVIAARPSSPASAVDDRTFGKPHATDHVVAAESVVLACRWSDALELALTGHENTDGDLVITPESGGATVTATVQFSKVPVPEFAIGERVEVDLVLAVVDQLTHV